MGTSHKKTGARPETLARRQSILQAATEVFGIRGYANGTLQEIADQVGMTHAGILHHFGSKDQLLLEVLAYRDQRDVAHMAGQHIPGGLDLFRHLVHTAYLNAQRAGIVQTFAVLSGESVTEGHPAAQFFRDRYSVLRGELAEAFEQVCHERGILDPGPIAHASAGILAVMDGLQIQWLLNPEAVDLAPATEFAIEAIVAGVLHPHTGDLAGPSSDVDPVG